MLQIALLNPREHERTAFICGEETLDRYLREQAAQHHRDGIATTHVLLGVATSERILGYYTLCAAQLMLEDLQEADRRRVPRYPVPAVRMARLAVACEHQGQGHGAFLLAHAIARSLELRAQLGVRVMVVNALHDRAAAFYASYGFRETADRSGALYLPLGKAD